MSHCLVKSRLLLNKTCSSWSPFNSGLFTANLIRIGGRRKSGFLVSIFFLSMRYPIGFLELISIALIVVQSLSCIQLFVTPWTAACQASCYSLSPRVCLSSCPLNQWCHPTISSSVSLFSFCLQGLFLDCLHQVAKVLELQLQHQSFQ